MRATHHELRRIPAAAAITLLLAAGKLLAAEPAAPAGAGDPAAIARRTVAQHIGVEPATVRLISVTPRVFNDGSLGCPDRDGVWPQVITPGHVVLVEAGGRRFDVRVANGLGRICHGGGRRAVPTDPEQRGPSPAELARRALSARLGMSPDTVRVIRSGMATGNERPPGCTVVCKGRDCDAIVVLDAGGREYVWLVRDGVARSCPPMAAR